MNETQLRPQSLSPQRAGSGIEYLPGQDSPDWSGEHTVSAPIDNLAMSESADWPGAETPPDTEE